MQLDEEHETLDWGNEEEEYQDSRRYYPAGKREVDMHAGDDVEDTISLGDDEDDQRFYSISRQDGISSSASFPADSLASPPSSQSKSTLSGANTAKSAQKPVNLSPQESAAIQDATQKKPATLSLSPRSLPRLTHALPPKPVAASVSALSPPYVVAATLSPRSTGRDSKKMNGNSAKQGLSPEVADLPQDWEVRFSRKGETYYYNRVTHDCTWAHPASIAFAGAPATQEELKPRRQRSASPTGDKQPVSFDSKPSRPQTSISNRDMIRNGAPIMESRRRPLSPDADGLTFEDRHYRPGLNSNSISEGIRSYDRSDNSTSARYARSPSPRRRTSPSPLASKESDHFRTKELPRDQRSSQEKPSHRTSSKLDTYVPDIRRMLPSPPRSRTPAGYHGRGHRDRTYPSEEERMQVDDREEPPAKKEDIGRDHRQRSRDRDLPPARNLDVREPSASENYYSAQRSRSPAPFPPIRERDHDMWDGRREAREHGYVGDGLGPSAHHSSLVSAVRSDRGERDAQRSEWERSRPRDRTPDPRNDQDYPKGRERPINAPEDHLRARNLERERGRDERPEREGDLISTRREVNVGIDTDRPLIQRSRESLLSEPRGSQGDTASKRDAENYDGKPEDASARPKRAPLPPQQASFRSARVKDVPPHQISTPPNLQGANLTSVTGDLLSRQSRHSSSTVQPAVLDLRRSNGVDVDRVYDGHERLSYVRDTTSYPDKRLGVSRDETSHPGRRKFGSTDRGLRDDPQRPSDISADSGRREWLPRDRVPNNVGRKDTEVDNPKDEHSVNKEGGNDRDDRHLENASSRRGKETQKQLARLTGTNNVPIGSRRTGYQTGPMTIGPEIMSPGLAALESPLSIKRNLPPGKESYERPPDLILSDFPRQSDPPARTESGRTRSSHESRHPQMRRDDEIKGRKPLPPPLMIAEQYSNGSGKRTSTPPPVSREISSSIPSNVPERSSTFPSTDSNISGFHASRKPDLPPKPRGPYIDRDDPTLRRESRRLLHYSPRRPLDEIDAPYSYPAGDPLPPRLRKSLPGGADPNMDARYDSSGDSKRSPISRADFLSRVEPPSLRRGGSLLDRLSSVDHGLVAESPSLRDRLIPSKRDRDEMMNSEGSSSRGGHAEQLQDEGSESKRAKRRGGKRRSGGRRL